MQKLALRITGSISCEKRRAAHQESVLGGFLSRTLDCETWNHVQIPAIRQRDITSRVAADSHQNLELLHIGESLKRRRWRLTGEN